MGCRHSSVDLSAPSILLPWVKVPSGDLRFYQIIIELCDVEKTKMSKKQAGIGPLKELLHHCHVLCRSGDSNAQPFNCRTSMLTASATFILMFVNVVNKCWMMNLELMNTQRSQFAFLIKPILHRMPLQHISFYCFLCLSCTLFLNNCGPMVQ